MHQERHGQLASCNQCTALYPFAYAKLAFELLKFLPEVTLGEKDSHSLTEKLQSTHSKLSSQKGFVFKEFNTIEQKTEFLSFLPSISNN